jgi:hypothetical protein
LAIGITTGIRLFAEYFFQTLDKEAICRVQKKKHSAKKLFAECFFTLGKEFLRRVLFFFSLGKENFKVHFEAVN